MQSDQTAGKNLVLAFALLSSCAFVSIQMGGDGGTKATKRKYLGSTGLGKRKGVPGDVDLVSNKTNDSGTIAETRLGTCAMSTEPLSEPIVCCELGNLYNKEEVVKYLLSDKEARGKLFGGAFQHIRKLKDVRNAVFSKKTTVGNEACLPPKCWNCPVTGVEMNGRTPFCMSWNSGHVYSMRAMQEVPQACGDLTGGVVPLAPSRAEQDTMRKEIKAKRDKIRKERKMKKRKKS